MQKLSFLFILAFTLISNRTFAQTNIFGASAGNTSLTGTNNSGFGYFAGRNISSANGNTLIGASAGSTINTGGANTLIGTLTGTLITTGAYNTILGYQTGFALTSGSNFNTLLGSSSGAFINGNENTMLGVWAGRYNDAAFTSSLVNGNGLTLLGFKTTASEGLSYATAIGYQARVTASNAIVLGSTTTNVGIGVTAPSAKLEVNSAISGASGLKFTQMNSNSVLSTGNGKSLSVDANGNVILVAAGTSLGGAYWNLNTANNNINNSNTGCVVIGTGITTYPTGYKLFVSDGIMTERIKVAVKNTTNWADFVFAPNYRLRPLSEVAQHIAQYKHLPDVPSAQEVVNNGLDLAENQAKLLQKIEELTLYVIEQDKALRTLKNQVKSIKHSKR